MSCRYIEHVVTWYSLAGIVRITWQWEMNEEVDKVGTKRPLQPAIFTRQRDKETKKERNKKRVNERGVSYPRFFFPLEPV